MVGVNSAPNFLGLPFYFSDENSPVYLSFTLSDVTNPELFSSIRASGILLALEYAPNTVGESVVTVRATDMFGLFLETSFTVTVTDDNRSPVSVADTYRTFPEKQLAIDASNGVLTNDTDPDGDGITAVHLADPQNGSLELNPDGSFVYTPDDTFYGTDWFSYAVSDGELGSDAAIVTIVTADNQRPASVADNYATSVRKLIVI